MFSRSFFAVPSAFFTNHIFFIHQKLIVLNVAGLLSLVEGSLAGRCHLHQRIPSTDGGITAVVFMSQRPVFCFVNSNYNFLKSGLERKPFSQSPVP